MATPTRIDLKRQNFNFAYEYAEGVRHKALEAFRRADDQVAADMFADALLLYHALATIQDDPGTVGTSIATTRQKENIPGYICYCNAMIAGSYANAKEYSEAISYGEDALSIDVENFTARMALANAYLGLGDWEEAWKHLEFLYIIREKLDEMEQKDVKDGMSLATKQKKKQERREKREKGEKGEKGGKGEKGEKA